MAFFFGRKNSEKEKGVLVFKTERSRVWAPMIEQSIAVSIDTCGSDYDTEIGVYTLANCNLVLQVSNDDSTFCPVGTLQSRVLFTFDAGVEYFIVVDGFDDDEFGDFNLNIEILPPPSPPPPPPPPLPPFPPGTVSVLVLRAPQLFDPLANALPRARRLCACWRMPAEARRRPAPAMNFASTTATAVPI